MIWHDLIGEGVGHSAGSNAGRFYVERGSVRSADGRNLAWELQTADGRTGELQIDGVRYEVGGLKGQPNYAYLDPRIRFN